MRGASLFPRFIYLHLSPRAATSWTSYLVFLLPKYLCNLIWLPSYCPVNLCYLLAICRVKTRRNLHLHVPLLSSQDPFIKWLISWGKLFPLVIAIVCTWDSICFTNEKWFSLLHKGILCVGFFCKKIIPIPHELCTWNNKGSFLYIGENWILPFQDSLINFQEYPWIWGF